MNASASPSTSEAESAIAPLPSSSTLPEPGCATGGSLTGATATLTVPCADRGSAAPAVRPSSATVYEKLAAPLKFAAGVNAT